MFDANFTQNFHYNFYKVFFFWLVTYDFTLSPRKEGAQLFGDTYLCLLIHISSSLF